MFRQLFKPKWQRQQPEQRLQALEQLTPSNSKDAESIATLCRDENAVVQKAAIERCALLSVLRSLAEQNPSTAETTQNRTATLLSSFTYLAKEHVLTPINLEQD